MSGRWSVAHEKYFNINKIAIKLDNSSTTCFHFWFSMGWIEIRPEENEIGQLTELCYK